jgi:FKBP-type peptidyl-prolyl cis-trans isomerase FkpA
MNRSISRRSNLLALARAVGVLLLTWTIAGCVGDDSSGPEFDPNLGPNPEDVTFAASLGVDLSQMTRTASGLYLQDLEVGTGAEATNGSIASVDYSGWLANGQLFDTSLGRVPFTFTVGAGQVIPGWDEGVPGMKVGGLRKLVIPAALGYGAFGQGPIPPNAVLVFDVRLRDVDEG